MLGQLQSRVGMFCCVLSLLAPMNAGGQQPEVRVSSHPYKPVPLFQSERDVVQLEVVVRDSRGQTLHGLSQANFEVLDEGRPQQITSFREEGAHAGNAGGAAAPDAASAPRAPVVRDTEPVSVALFFDNFHTDSGNLSRVKAAATDFVKHSLRAKDRIAIFQAASESGLSLTDDQAKAIAAIEAIHPQSSGNELSSCPRISPHEAYAIVNGLDPEALEIVEARVKRCTCTIYCPSQLIEDEAKAAASSAWEQEKDASRRVLETLNGVVQYMSAAPGRRVVLFASMGFVEGDLEREMDRITNGSIRDGVTINALDAAGLEAVTPGGALSEQRSDTPSIQEQRYEEIRQGARHSTDMAPMVDLASGTGGRLIFNRNDLAAVMSQLVAFEGAYHLEFSPNFGKRDGKFHKIKVALNGASASAVQVRPGYFAASGSETAPEQIVNDEALGNESKEPFPVTIHDKPARTSGGGSGVLISATVDTKGLKFRDEGGRRMQTLLVTFVLFTSDGSYVSGKQGEMIMSLKPETYKKFESTGISAMMILEAPPGTYRLRTVVREGLTGKLYAATQRVVLQQ